MAVPVVYGQDVNMADGQTDHHTSKPTVSKQERKTIIKLEQKY
jgi:hypothetical protein